MRALFANIPFIKQTAEGRLCTGPNAGSRWPWTLPGLSDYACFPFFMAYAVSYVRAHGVDAGFYDGVALKHYHSDLVRDAVRHARPEILFLETSTPVFPAVEAIGRWAKQELGCRIVLVGPHMQAYADDLIGESWVDHCVIGEYESPSLEISRDPERAAPIYRFAHLDDIDRIGADNFLPFRPWDSLFDYWDPSMSTDRIQLQVNTSRGCPFKCTYCQWPKVMNNGRYRSRSPELVIDEIRQVVGDYAAWRQGIEAGIAATRTELVAKFAALGDRLEQLRALGDGAATGKPALAAWAEQFRLLNLFGDLEIKSIFFDDDTWNLGRERMRALCAGLKRLGMPWTMMGRIDTSPVDIYDMMVDSGCVGMRFGVESFNQRLLDNSKKSLDAARSQATIAALLERFSGMEVHLTMMRNLPGQVAGDWERDHEKLLQLSEIAARRDNRLHWQVADCIAFPGTELWDEMVEMGKGELLRDFRLYDGQHSNSEKLSRLVGWLGSDYAPKRSKYSDMGNPTEMPEA